METNIAELIKQKYNHLPNSQRKVADYILNHGGEVMNHTLFDLAAKSGVSIPSVVRFTHTIGYSGFSEFKKAILLETGQQQNQDNGFEKNSRVNLDFSPKDSLSDVPKMVVDKSIRGMQDTLNLLDRNDFEEAITKIISAKRVSIYGIGTSSSVALDFVSRLIRIGIPATYYSDIHLQQLAVHSYTEDDLLIGISHSGATMDAVDTLKLAKSRGVQTIALTNYKSHFINEYADISLLTGDNETSLYSETMVSRISLLTLIDMLYIGIILSDYDHYTQQLEQISHFVDSKNY
ncbi:MurR/RpiR family transcriptional regulator [Aerococcus urinae]|uniref:MurR/RpiR family transcriptional regulator n=1 Tax=Aerococcus urinae TaxID=1376 RepID=UPI00254A60F3|nr:MurR/RpiR family transcriptional regulator [Aerococcus urinae]MDK7191480.1 MurR/RpiR family transcriptional regulator [Aerococcus urinae]MDK8390821.1 MurR/RpiR family transcriptional regulator [Aerococcus urinae]